MFYRVRIDLAFDTEAPARSIVRTALDHFSKAHTINPGQPDHEQGFIIKERCFHDEDPTKPCDILENHWTPD